MAAQGEAESHSLKRWQVIPGTKAWIPSKHTKLTAVWSIASQRRVDCFSGFGFFQLMGKRVQRILITACTFKKIVSSTFQF